jgi:hypothetical protein
MPGSAPAIDKDEGSRQGNFGAQSHSVRSRCLRFAVTVARPHARLASRLLARLCRTGLVTRRVSTKGFTFCDDSPFPSFVAQCQTVFFVFGRADFRETCVRVTSAGGISTAGALARVMISVRSPDSFGDAPSRASSRRVRLGTLSARDRPSQLASSRSDASVFRRQSEAATALARWGS